MRTDGKMSYKDYVFPVNPSVIKISHRRKVSKASVPNGYDTVSDMGGSCRIITGEGEFFGNCCVDDFLALKAVMDKGGGGMLYIPSQSPIYAMLEELNLIAEDCEGVIRYNFKFVESFEEHHEERNLYCYGDRNQCLWDISYIYGIHIDILRELNPHIKRPDIPIYPWEKVRLC